MCHTEFRNNVAGVGAFADYSHVVTILCFERCVGLGELYWHNFERNGRQINVSIIEHSGCV